MTNLGINDQCHHLNWHFIFEHSLPKKMKFLFCLISLFLIPGSAVGFYEGLVGIFNTQGLLLPLTVGFGLGIIISILIMRYFQWFTTFDHELTHALMALLFLRRIRRFIVSSKNGGYVGYSGGFGGEFGNLIITAAPYFLPTFSIIAILFLPLVGQQTIFYYNMFIGFTLIYHIMSSAEETIRNWNKEQFTNVRGETSETDIGRIGYIAAVLSITGFTLFCYGFIFCMIRYGYSGVWPFCKMVFFSSWNVYHDLSLTIISVVNELINKHF
jgi:hypothetical protein